MATSSGASELEEAKQKIRELETDLKSLPPDNPERLPVQQQLAAVRQELATLRQKEVLLLQIAGGPVTNPSEGGYDSGVDGSSSPWVGSSLTDLVRKLEKKIEGLAAGHFFDDDLAVCSAAGEDPQFQPLTSESLQRLQEAINGKRRAVSSTRAASSKTAKVEPLTFNCTGVVFHEAGLIGTTWHSVVAMLKADKMIDEKDEEVDEILEEKLKQGKYLVTALFPAFSLEDGIKQCRVEHWNEKHDFARLRMVDKPVPNGAGSYFLEVFRAGPSQRQPRPTDSVAVVSGRVYRSRTAKERSPPQVTVSKGCIESIGPEEIVCSCSTFPGDSGAAIIMRNGKLLAMHLGEENSAERNHGSKRAGSSSGASYSRSSYALPAHLMVPGAD